MSAVCEGGGERDPFSLTASPEGYVPTANVSRVLGDAVACLDEGRVPLIFGPAGLGKTLVLQLVGKERSDRAHPVYIAFCSLPPAELAALVLGLLELPMGDDPEMQLLEEARRYAQGGRPLLLLVDDAGSLPGETAAQLAHWCNASGGALEVALAGLPGAALRHVCDAFGDRAEEILHAGGLRSEEIGRYVKARIEGAGADPSLLDAFDERALAELERVSDGNPRKLHLAAQAIVRNAQHQQQLQQAGEQPDASDSGPARSRLSFPSAARELTQVGQYRFVGGRFVDPNTGALLDDGADPVRVDREEEAPEEPRAHETEIPSGIDLTLAADVEPSAKRSGAADAIEPEEEVLPPRGTAGAQPSGARRSAPGTPRLPYASIVLGVVLVAFAVGLLTQLTGEGDVETAEAPARGVTPTEIAPAEEATAEVARPAEEVAAEVPEPSGAPAAEGEEAPVEVGAAAGDAPVEVAVAAVPAEAGAATTPEETPEGEPVAAPTEAPATPPAEAATGAPETSPAEVAPPAAEVVRVSINATPWAVIEIDGEEIGETPLAGIELRTGRHRFRARMPDGDIRERVERIDADNHTVVFE